MGEHIADWLVLFKGDMPVVEHVNSTVYSLSYARCSAKVEIGSNGCSKDREGKKNL